MAPNIVSPGYEKEMETFFEANPGFKSARAETRAMTWDEVQPSLVDEWVNSSLIL